MSSLINVNLSTTEQLTEVCFRGSSCIDISPALRKELYIDGVKLEVGGLLLIKDNQPDVNGIYKLSKFSTTKGFVLTRKIALDKLTSATIYVLNGVVNKGRLYALVRRTRKNNMLDFELIQSNNYPLRNLINEDDKTELELSTETQTLLKNYSANSLSDSNFNDRLNLALSKQPAPVANNSTEVVDSNPVNVNNNTDTILEDDAETTEEEDKDSSVTYTNTEKDGIIIQFNGRCDALQNNIDDLNKKIEAQELTIKSLEDKLTNLKIVF